MMRLSIILHLVIATMLMGMGVTGVLAAGMDGAWPIVIAALAGFVLAIPVSWYVAKQILAVKR
ncbi:MAG: hypothetical protein H6918_03145 [Sphingomonadaceae bacterium]|nr:hypothetical protein [Sphingomonadaceae bacterium]